MMYWKKLNKTDDIANNQQERYQHKRYCALITCNTLIPRKKIPINILLIRRKKFQISIGIQNMKNQTKFQVNTASMPADNGTKINVIKCIEYVIRQAEYVICHMFVWLQYSIC